MRSLAGNARRPRLAAAIVLTALAIPVLAAVAAPRASAAPAVPVHATLVTTSPADGAVLATRPGTVSAVFDQPVGVSPDSLVVYTPGGQRADAGGARNDGADGIEVALSSGLGRGTYTAEWHVVSADSHEVQGAFTFSVGAASATHVPPVKAADAALTATLYAAARMAEYVFFALLAGSVAFLLFCWPEGTRRKGVAGLVVTGWAGLIVSTLAAVLLQGPYSQNATLGQALNPALELTTLHSRLGTALQVRQVLALAAAIAVKAWLSRIPRLTRRGRLAAGAGWAVLVAGIAATWAASDHASTGFQVPLAIAADVVHLCAMAAWGGGLLMLAAFTLRGPADAAAAMAVRRFSPIALGCVVALAVTGGYMAWRLVGTWGALFGTTYGWLIVAKSAALGVLVCLGYLARRFIHHRLLHVQEIRVPDVELALASAARTAGPGGSGHGTTGRPGEPSGPGEPSEPSGRGEPSGPGKSPEPGGPSMRDLRLSVTAEIGVVALVLGLTAVLVNTATGRESYAPPVHAAEHFDTGGPGGAGTVDVSVTPARLGDDQVTLAFSAAPGRPMVPAQVQASLILPSRGLGPLPVALASPAPGHYQARGAVTFTFTGQWELEITVRTDDFDETTIAVPVTVHQ